MRARYGAALIPAVFFALSACEGGGETGSGGAGGQGGSSAEVDECSEGTAICDENADCVDTPGYYECVCKAGYEGDGKTCSDVDECQLLLDDCDKNAVCENLPGSFSCSCPPGLVGDGKTCTPRYLSVAAGQYHACAIRTDKSIWCWGFNTSGQAGTGTGDTFFVRPVSIGDAKDYKQVTAGAFFSCGLHESGTVSCWGTNSLGQLGDGTTSGKTSPILGAGGTSDWAFIDAGNNHVCGIKDDGSAHCWGRNLYGQLGDGSADNDGNGTADNETSPVPVVGGATWLALSAGSDFTCGVQSDHTLWCFGLGTSRQLGTGTTASSEVPVQEKTLATDWADVSTGNAWACGVKLDGTRHCWGANNVAQAGNGDQAAVTEPTQADSETSWASLILGLDSSACGLRTNGSLWCWGDGSMGQTAQPGAESIALSPVAVGASADWVSVAGGLRFYCGVRGGGELVCWGAASRGALASGYSADRTDPSPVGAETDWSMVSANTDNTCGLRGDKMYCWGRNLLSNLGDGTGISRPEPAPIEPALPWKSVSVGRFFGCGLTGNDIHCWGRDDLGQLGNGPGVTHSPAPAKLADTASTSPWKQVVTGQDGACAIKNDQTLWCWGSDGLGQIGDGGSATTQHEPKQVLPADTANWKHVSVSRDTICALRGAGTLWCWGRNGDGQVGNGTAAGNVTAPVQVGTGTYKSVEAGAFHACAVTTGGALRCWGRNTSGELGQGNTMSPMPAPVQVGTDTDWERVYVGVGALTCATKTDSTLYCWGAGGFGQLGIGSYTNKNTPQLVPSTGAWSQLAIGNEHVCGLGQDGRLSCWGASTSAQLGSGVPFVSVPTPVLNPL